MASNLKTEHRDESFPWITPEEMTTWDILHKVRLEAKRCLVALKKPKPKIKKKILEKYLQWPQSACQEKDQSLKTQDYISLGDSGEGLYP